DDALGACQILLEFRRVHVLLAAAHRLAVNGHSVVIYDAREKYGGLNEYGIATYKKVDEFAQKEVDYVLSIGGIEVRNGRRLGQEFSLTD
ncbi:hypothetical protein AB9E31_36015, partial [Rhizobium leguminosarum]